MEATAANTHIHRELPSSLSPILLPIAFWTPELFNTLSASDLCISGDPFY